MNVIKNYATSRFPHNRKPEIPLGKSMTRPDQTRSIEDMVKHYSALDKPLNSIRQEVYNGDILLPEIEKLDFTDLDAYKQSLEVRRLEIEQKKKELAELQQMPDDSTFEEKLAEAIVRVNKREQELKKELTADK